MGVGDLKKYFQRKRKNSWDHDNTTSLRNELMSQSNEEIMEDTSCQEGYRTTKAKDERHLDFDLPKLDAKIIKQLNDSDNEN